jgi:hypothetical protein
MSETHILIRLLRIYIPRISEFGPASEFGGGVWTPQTPPRYATVEMGWLDVNNILACVIFSLELLSCVMILFFSIYL